jgi:hypothetical protein
MAGFGNAAGLGQSGRGGFDDVENRSNFLFVMREGHAFGENIRDHQSACRRQFLELHDIQSSNSVLSIGSKNKFHTLFFNGLLSWRNLMQCGLFFGWRQPDKHRHAVAEENDEALSASESERRRRNRLGIGGAVNRKTVPQQTRMHEVAWAGTGNCA